MSLIPSISESCSRRSMGTCLIVWAGCWGRGRGMRAQEKGRGPILIASGSSLSTSTLMPSYGRSSFHRDLKDAAYVEYNVWFLSPDKPRCLSLQLVTNTLISMLWMFKSWLIVGTCWKASIFESSVFSLYFSIYEKWSSLIGSLICIFY